MFSDGCYARRLVEDKNAGPPRPSVLAWKISTISQADLQTIAKLSECDAPTEGTDRRTVMTALAMPFARRAAAAMIPGLIAMRARIVTAARKRRAARRTTSALMAIDDRTLKDIGLHRSEIVFVASDASMDRGRHRS
jgi:uncharacterized protein YjiS (DUF1127 family)